MNIKRWILIVLGGVVIVVTYLSDLLRGGREISLGPRSYTVITFGILLIIIGIVFFEKKKDRKKEENRNGN